MTQIKPHWFFAVIISMFFIVGCSNTSKRLDVLENKMNAVFNAVSINQKAIILFEERVGTLERMSGAQYKTVKKLVADSRLAGISAKTIGFDYGPFYSGSTKLTQNMQTRLNILIKNIQNGKYKLIAIYGFSDTKGNSKQNKILSQKRAEAIASYLKAKSVDIGNIKILGMGEFAYSVKDSDSRIATVEVEVI